jgi:2-oxo-3-hexenedioate decarboxylase
MSKVEAELAELAERLDHAATSATAIPQLSASVTISVEDAYEIQCLSIDRRIARGEKIVGLKLGFTSKAKMIQMGVDDMIWGRLTDQMTIEEGASIDLSGYVHPRIEPEVAFLIDKPLRGDVTLDEALAAVESVAPAMELIDSRYEAFKFNLADVVADNCSSSGYVIGAWQEPGADLTDLRMQLDFDGKTVQAGSSAAILGNPLESLVNAARLADSAGFGLEPGWIVLAGAATAAEAMRPGTHVRAVVEQLGTVELSVNE